MFLRISWGYLMCSPSHQPFFTTAFRLPSSHLSDSDYGLVWKVQGYDDRYPEDHDLAIFDRIGVYGSLKGNSLHDNYMGACE